MLPPWVALAVRPSPGVWEYLKVNLHGLVVEELQPAEFLQFKEELVDGVYVTIFLTSILFFLISLYSTMLFEIAVRMVISLLNLILSHSMRLSLAQRSTNTLEMVLSSLTGTSRLSSSMTRRVCFHCLSSFVYTATRAR